MFDKALDRLARVPRVFLATHMAAKFIFGVGVGILLHHYESFDGGLVGWIFIVVAVIVAIPSSIKILSGLGGNSS